MVNRSEIERIMERWFTVTGPWHVNDQGQVDVDGSVSLRAHPDGSWPEIPVPFGNVTGKFEAKHVGLRSLKNSPRTVNMSLVVNNNLLKSLTHAPDLIGEDFEAYENGHLTELACDHCVVKRDLDVTLCNLTSLKGCPQVSQGIWAKENPRLTDLKGIPACEELFVSYLPDLGLLPALVVSHIVVRELTHHFPDDPDAHSKLRKIIRKYAGKGKSHILLCSNELKQAGFAGNARW
jgi:hypothetical protein